MNDDVTEESGDLPPPLYLKSWQEFGDLKAKHLKPVHFTPKGWPVYDGQEVDALLDRLNAYLPDEY